MAIKDWSDEDKPREKLMSKGADACSLSELLAIVMTNGTTQKSAVQLADEVLQLFDNNLIMFVRAGIEEYMNVTGIGPAKACIIKAVAELGKRIHLASVGDVVKVNDTITAYNMMSFLKTVSAEEFWILCTNNAGMLLRKSKIAQGNGGEVTVDFRVMVSQLLSCNATRVILCHNHPGGTSKPSQADIKLTNSIVDTLKPLKISVVEHIIVAGDGYYSFLENSLL